jgi:kynureninase
MGSIATEDLQHTGKPTFPDEANTLEYAKSLDSKDNLRSFRQQFKIPSKSSIKATKVVKQGWPHSLVSRDRTDFPIRTIR